MTTSEKLLTAIAIRLAGLVVVGFIAQTMVADHPQSSSSNAQGNRFNQHEQEIDDVRVLSTPY